MGVGGPAPWMALSRPRPEEGIISRARKHIWAPITTWTAHQSSPPLPRWTVDQELAHRPGCFLQLLPFLKAFLFFKALTFFFIHLSALNLRCCADFPLVVVSGGHSSCAVWASHCGGVSCSGSQTLGARASVVAAPGPQNTGSIAVVPRLSCSTACVFFPDQGSYPCPLHWQVDSSPLDHQGSPRKLCFQRVHLIESGPPRIK